MNSSLKIKCVSSYVLHVDMWEWTCLCMQEKQNANGDIVYYCSFVPIAIL